MKDKILKYSITFVAGAVIALLTMIFFEAAYELFSIKDSKQLYAYISDIFLIPGASLICFGLLAAIANEGFFDFFGFAFSNFTYLFSKHKEEREKEKFIDYHERKKEERKEKSSKWFMVFVGLIYMVPCVLFAILYYC